LRHIASNGSGHFTPSNRHVVIQQPARLDPSTDTAEIEHSDLCIGSIMTKRNIRKILGSTAIMLAMSGGAFADVTAQEVWDNWVAYGQSFGETITAGSTNSTSNGLTLRDVQISMDMAEGKFSGTIQQVDLKELGDGTVAVTMSDSVPMSVSITPKMGDSLDLTMILKQSGLTMIASGGNGTFNYDYKADQMGLSVDKLFVGGEDLAPQISVNMTDLSGNSSIVEGDTKMVDGAFKSAHAKIDVNFTDPKQGGKVALTYDISDMAGTTTASIPNEMDFSDPSLIFSDEVDLKASYSTGPITFMMDAEDPEAPFHLEGGSQSSVLNVGFGKGSISYGGTSTGLEYKISSPAIPFPELTASIEEAAFNLVMPLRESDAPMDFALMTKIGGLKVDETLWNMVDPAGVLPHDPATVNLDMAGKMNWLVDITDPEAMTASVPGATPIALQALTLNNVTVDIAGAEVTGQGDFTFDNSDTTTFDGMPAPDGKVDFKIVGVNGLMDKLIQMGLLPEDQAMGARMMLGMFARPADGPDTLTSTIQVNPDGSILANDQRIK